MNARLKTAFSAEMNKARQYFQVGELEQAFSHLERAHILGQKSTIRHTYSHCWMLKVGIRRRDYREVFGQSLRLVAALIFSRVWVPVGNTGGANVSPVKPMPIPEDLRQLLDDN